MRFGEAAQFAKGDLWVTPKYEDYLQHRDVEAEYRALSNPMHRPERIREGNWSASSSGDCMRRQQFTYLGMTKIPYDAKLMNIFANGDYVHLRHQAFGLVAGYITSVETPVRLPDLRLRGTMDGVLTNGEGLEIKSINPYGYSAVVTHGPQLKHKKQVNAYMMASGLEKFRFIYENKGDNTIKEFLTEADESLQKEVTDELTMLNEATEDHKLLPMLSQCVEHKGEFPRCPYRSICETAQYPAQLRIRRAETSSLARS